MLSKILSVKSTDVNNNHLHNRFHPRLTLILLFLIFLAAGCDLNEVDDPEMIFETDFRSGDSSDWEAFFTGYPVSYEGNMDFDSGIEPLPNPLNSDENGMYITATNRSDDVKMLFRKKVDGLEPNTTYSVLFSVEFATKTPSGCDGIGGAPGESVKVIADASDMRPEPAVEDEGDDGYYRLNIQYMGESQEWYQNSIMGDIANSRECEEDYEFEIKEVSSAHNHSTVTTDDNGEAWLMFGTRSGFEGTTQLYYTSIRTEFR